MQSNKVANYAAPAHAVRLNYRCNIARSDNGALESVIAATRVTMVTRLTIIYHNENENDGDASEQPEKSRRAETDSPRRRSKRREDPLEHRSSLSSPWASRRGGSVGKRCGRNIMRFIARILRRVLQYRGDALAGSRARRDIGIVIARDTSRYNDRFNTCVLRNLLRTARLEIGANPLRARNLLAISAAGMPREVPRCTAGSAW